MKSHASVRKYRNRFNLPPLVIWTVMAVCIIPALAVLPYFNRQSGLTLPDSSNNTITSYLIYNTWLVLGIVAAIISGILALVDYTFRKSISTAITGGTLLIAGLYEIYYLVSELAFPGPDFSENACNSWFISRALHAALLAVSTAYFIFISKGTKKNTKVRTNNFRLLLIIYLLFLAFAIASVPSVNEMKSLHREHAFITHPFELIILAVYLTLGFVILPGFQVYFPSLFARIVILSIIPSAFANAFMAIHKDTFDIFFNTACFLRFIGYLIPLTGIGINYIQMSRKEKNFINTLHLEIHERITIQENLEEREALLARTSAELETRLNELKRSNSELEQFAYVASHDMQEPLRKIKAFGERLDSSFASLLPDQGKDYIARMRNAAERMQTLIDDLLSLSRLRRIEKELSPVNLDNVIRGVISDLEYSIEKKDARIEVNAALMINAIPAQIRQLFQNLISNSLKFSKPSVPPFIQINAQYIKECNNKDLPDQLSASAAFCLIEIKDNGIGFDRHDSKKIFNLFQRLHNRSDYEGTGIGLALCKKITDNHLGYIEAEGREGEGTVIRVYLPFFNEHA